MSYKLRTKVVRQGRMDADGAGGSVWAVFPARYSDERIRAFLERHSRWANFIEWRFGSWSPSMCDGFYNGAGQSYADDYTLRRGRNRVIAHQYFGCDV